MLRFMWRPVRVVREGKAGQFVSMGGETMSDYGKLTDALLDELRGIVGAERFESGDGVGEAYSHDEMPIYGKSAPDAVCRVESTEEVSRIMKLCYEHKIPVTVRGAGTGLVGGCVPVYGGVVISTEKMNHIL